MSDAVPPPAQGKALIAEDDFFIASALANVLADAGWQVEGPYASLQDTLAAAEATDCAIAFIDISLRRESSYEAIRKLIARGIRVVICSGYNPDHMPEDLRHLPRLPKPYTDEMVLEQLAAATQNGTSPA